MAEVGFCVNFEDVALTVGSWKSVCALRAPTNQLVKLLKVAAMLEGIAGDAKPIGMRLMKLSTAGAGTATAATPERLNSAISPSNSNIPRSTARVNFSAEPSDSGKYLYAGKVHPQGGAIFNVEFDGAVLADDSEVVLQLKIPSAQVQVNASGHLVAEE